MNVVQVRLEAVDVPVGHLRSEDSGAVEFAYHEDYLGRSDAHAISLALPLAEGPFPDAETRPFFSNLLPENDQLRSVLEREGLDRGDLVSILFHLGSDISGALSCLPVDAPPAKVPGHLQLDYDFLDKEQVDEIVRRLAGGNPLPDELRDPSPVAGYQQKIALVVANDGRFAIPKAGSGVPTTHILKVPNTSIPREAFYEARAAEIGRDLGLDVAPSESGWIAKHEVLIATRFDRTLSSDGQIYRLHQEDFAQAMSLPPSLKYERNGRPGRIFRAEAIAALLMRTASPAAAIDAFLKETFFNLAIGNTDNHAKNHALIYDVGPIPRLAPLYDMVPILLSEIHHHRFAFKIGAACEAGELTKEDILTFLAVFGFNPPAARRYLDNTIVPFLQHLASRRGFEDDWSRRFDDLIVRESNKVLALLG